MWCHKECLEKCGETYVYAVFQTLLAHFVYGTLVPFKTINLVLFSDLLYTKHFNVFFATPLYGILGPTTLGESIC